MWCMYFVRQYPSDSVILVRCFLLIFLLIYYYPPLSLSLLHCFSPSLSQSLCTLSLSFSPLLSFFIAHSISVFLCTYLSLIAYLSVSLFYTQQIISILGILLLPVNLNDFPYLPHTLFFPFLYQLYVFLSSRLASR